MTTLVLAAHPDDEVLGCGGTMARLSDAGEKVHVAILGEGATARAPDGDSHGEVEALMVCAREAATVLGVGSPRFLGLPDNRFDTVPMLDIARWIESLIEELQPRVVYTQHGGDLNVDHVALFRATLTATRPLPGCSVREVLAYEVASSTEWAFGQFAPEFRPTTFIDISNSVERKIEAMACYRAELRDFPHPRSAEALRAIAVRWGSAVGVSAAEAFQLVREVR